MAFSTVSKKSGKTYFLHSRRQKLKGGQEVTLYYFGGEQSRPIISAAHWIIGIAALPLLVLHIVSGRRSRHREIKKQ